MHRPSFVLLPLILVMLSAWAAPVAAQTTLAESTPADGEAVPDPPSEVVLTFTSEFPPDSQVEVEVIDPVGDDLVAAPPTVNGTIVTIPLNLAVNVGEHEVRFAVVAADGVRQEESVTFVLDPPQSVLTPLPATSPGQSEPEAPSPPAPTPDDPEPTATPPEATDTEPSTPVSTDAQPSRPGATDAQPSTTTEASPLGGTVSPSPASESPISVDDGLSPAVVALLGALALAAIAAVVVLRVRRPDEDV